MLKPAELAPGRHFERMGMELVQASFNAFGKLHGTDVPIHIDPEYAAKTPFGGTIAHGMMLLAFFETWLCALFGESAWDRGGHFQGKLLGVAKVGDPLLYAMDVTAAASARASLALSLRSGERLLAVGEATIQFHTEAGSTAAGSTENE